MKKILPTPSRFLLSNTQPLLETPSAPSLHPTTYHPQASPKEDSLSTCIQNLDNPRELLRLANSLDPKTLSTLNASEFLLESAATLLSRPRDTALSTAIHIIQLKISMAQLITQLEKISTKDSPIPPMARDDTSSRNTIYEIWTVNTHTEICRHLSALLESHLVNDLNPVDKQNILTLCQKATQWPP